VKRRMNRLIIRR